MALVTGFDPRILHEILERLEASKDDPERFFGYRDDPLGFAEHVLGVPVWDEADPEVPGLVPEQVELLEAVAAGHARIAVKSCHGMGKTFVLAILVLWWLYTRRSLVVTTASTWEQVEKVLWREIGTLFRKARVPLHAMTNHPLNTELGITKDWLALGVSTNNPTALQGKHHPDLLVVIDEAPGVEAPVHRALRSLCTGARNVLVMVGNPTVTSGPFYDAFRKGNWHRLHFDGYNHPNIRLGREVIPGAITQQFIDEELAEWGSDQHPMYLVRVRGEFPEASQFGLYPVKWVDRAMASGRWDAEVKGVPDSADVIMAVDVARAGENMTVMGVRKGFTLMEITDWYQPDTMVTIGQVKEAAEKWVPVAIRVDEPGMGGPVIDRMLELGMPCIPFNTQRGTTNKMRFANLRAEVAWTFRKLLEEDRIALPDHERIREDLLSMQYRLTSAGLIRVETKEEMKARGVKSPDFGDTLVMLYHDEDGGAEDVHVADRGRGYYRLDQDTTLILGERPLEAEQFGGLGVFF